MRLILTLLLVCHILHICLIYNIASLFLHIHMGILWLSLTVNTILYINGMLSVDGLVLLCLER